MDIRQLNDYRFYTTADFANPLHDKRHRHGIEAKATIQAGTQVRVVVVAAFDANGVQVGGLVRHYYLDGRRMRDAMERTLGEMDPGSDEQPRTLGDLADRNSASAPWFSNAVLERLVATGVVTLDQCQQVWDGLNE